jgi:hypothetical protein
MTRPRACLVVLALAAAVLLAAAPCGATPAAVCRLQAAPSGEGAGDQFGINVAGEDDLNADGYDDYAVSGFLNDAAGQDAGRVYVYFGGPHADALPDLVMTGEAAGDDLGQLGDAGDVNGDGYPDMIIGANGHNGGRGRAYLYYGGPGMNNVPDKIFDGQIADALFAARVSCGSDVNGDGYADVLIGEIANPAKGSRTGRAYVYFGGPSMDTVPDVVFTGESAGSEFGLVASAGDVDRDGFDDIIIGAWRWGNDTGRAYLYLGGATMDTIADAVFTGAALGDRLGVSVRGLGDVNGDGYGDIGVGAYLNDAAGVDAGRAYIYYGGPVVDTVPDVVLTGEAADDDFGKSICGAGDVNRDGYADVAVGAFTSDANGYNAGRGYVYFGGSPMDKVPDVTLNGEAAGDHLGYWVGHAGDVNGDGFPDVLVGASFADSGPLFDAGRAYLWDFDRYQLSSPTGGENWPGGGSAWLAWQGSEPADVWLSCDGGATFTLFLQNVGGEPTNTIQVPVPNTPTANAMIELTPHDPWVMGHVRSPEPFTIGSVLAAPGALARGPAFVAPWPDPATDRVQLALDLDVASDVSVEAFDMAGRRVASPIERSQAPAGRLTRTWQPTALPRGVYVLRARIGTTEQTRRIVWVGR